VPTLPARPNLERLRREARAFQRACLAGDAEATRRLAAVFPGADPRGLALTMAQTVVARGYGLASWPALRGDVEARRAVPATPAADLDAAALAESWFSLAEAGELAALCRAFAIKRRRLEAAREIMRRSPNRYVAFQHALVGGLASRRERLRFQCAASLDQFGDASTRAPLAALMEDPVPRVRWMAMHALSCHACGEKSGPLEDDIRERIVAAALGDPSPQVRRHAAGALSLAHEVRALPALEQMLRRETDAKTLRMVAWALGELTRDAAKAAGDVV
jgi:hypothetical protein